VRQFIQIVENAVNPSPADLPDTLYHGTALPYALDILATNTMRTSRKTRDRGPTGISTSRDIAVCWRSFAPSGFLPGCVIALDTATIIATGHPIVHYKGAYASREKEERILGDIHPVIPAIKEIIIKRSMYGINTVEDVMAEMQRQIDRAPSVPNPDMREYYGSWAAKLAVMKKYRDLFRMS
jgi:hypothetical protein